MKLHAITTSILLSLLLALGLAWYLNSCSNIGTFKGKQTVINGKTFQVVKEVHDTVIIPIKQVVYKPGKEIQVDCVKYLPIDTAIPLSYQVKDYNSIRIYRDLIKLKDSLGFISLTDTLYQNKILGRTWTASVSKKIINNTIYIKDLPKNEWYFGGTTNISSNNVSIGPQIGLIDKRKNLYQLSIGLNNQVKPYVQVGVSWNLNK
jgi:hypothetical protein